MKEGSICNKCNHRAYCDMSDEHNNDNATIKGCYLYSEQKAKTNADRIRAMTNEELAEWASIREMCFIYHLFLINDPDLRSKCQIYESCKDCWLDWLKEECEE